MTDPDLHLPSSALPLPASAALPKRSQHSGYLTTEDQTIQSSQAAKLRSLWAHLAIGSAGVIVVSAFYILSPSVAVTPTFGQDMEAVRLVSLTDAGTMRLAGLFGVLADPFITIGALGLGSAYLTAGRTREAIGFYWLAVAALLYTFADAPGGFAIKPSAQAGIATFSVIKPLFDALLSGASLGYGLSAICLGWPLKPTSMAEPRWVMRALSLTGLIVATSGLACMLGAKAGLPLGAGLTVLTTLYTALGISQMRRSASLKEFQ